MTHFNTVTVNVSSEMGRIRKKSGTFLHLVNKILRSETFR